ncbi:MAG: MFS transporter [Leptospiraceae bacterium]|nr:MFS transporter [Leptospiraceae bacterium]
MSQENYYRPYRWVVLAAFMVVAGVNQMLWLNFVPLLSEIQSKYNVSETLASTLILCFPLLYVILSMHSGAMTDRKGYRFTVGLGAATMAVFSLARIYTDSFYALLIGQVGIAVAQPYILNGITKLSADWFAVEHRALATGLGTAGMFTGMALGLALSPSLNESYGLTTTMIIFAAITIVCSGFFLIAAKENHKTEPDEMAQMRSFTASSELLQLLKDPAIALVTLIGFLALGFFNGLTTWFEGLLGENGIDPVQAGLVGGVMILGGILGSLIIPAISDMTKRRKPYLVFCGISGLLLTMPLVTGTNITMVYVFGGLLGFLFLPGYALLLAMSEELAGAERAGGAAGALMMAGNAGAVIIAAAMDAIRSDTSGWRPAEYLLMAVLVVILGLAFFTRESFRTTPDA